MERKRNTNIGKIIVLIFSVMAVSFFVLQGCNSSAKKEQKLKPAQVGEKVAESTVEEKDTASYKKAEKKIPVLPEGPQQGKAYSVLINKSSYTLKLLEDNEPIATYKIAVGKNSGQKQDVGDLRTPDGSFTVDEICDASHWTHDFGDGKGEIKGAYGPLFISLYTPGWSGIGIHGTHDPASIGTQASEGCVRMHNKELKQLAKFVKVGTRVVIQE